MGAILATVRTPATAAEWTLAAATIRTVRRVCARALWMAVAVATRCAVLARLILAIAKLIERPRTIVATLLLRASFVATRLAIRALTEAAQLGRRLGAARLIAASTA